MTADERSVAQLQAIDWLSVALGKQGIDYWIFGGWAVDFHAGRATRDHSDVDIALWQADFDRVGALLEANGWVHDPEPGEDGYTGYERGPARLEFAFLASDQTGVVYTPLADGRGEWPAGSFGDVRGSVGSVEARVVGLASLIEDKSGPRDDPATIAKDQADVAILTALGTGQ